MLVELKTQRTIVMLLHDEEKIDLIWKPFNNTHINLLYSVIMLIEKMWQSNEEWACMVLDPLGMKLCVNPPGKSVGRQQG